VVIAVDKHVGNLKKTGNLRPYELDVTDWTALKKLYCDVLSKHGRIDIVVNNAGLFERNPSRPLKLPSMPVVSEGLMNSEGGTFLG
jgi:NAD(P)-dependent dehydrogenase (short-subunit alcohol dehydrogenase family)